MDQPRNLFAQLPEEIVNLLLLQYNLQSRGRFSSTSRVYHSKLREGLNEDFARLHNKVELALIQHDIPVLHKFVERGVKKIYGLPYRLPREMFDNTDEAIDTYVFVINNFNHYPEPNSNNWHQQFEVIQLIFGYDWRKLEIKPSVAAVERLIDTLFEYKQFELLKSIFRTKRPGIISEKYVEIIYYYLSKELDKDVAKTVILEIIHSLINNPNTENIPGIEKLSRLLAVVTNDLLISDRNTKNIPGIEIFLEFIADKYNLTYILETYRQQL